MGSNFIPELFSQPLAAFSDSAAAFEFDVANPVNEVIGDGSEDEMSDDLAFVLKAKFSEPQVLLRVPEKHLDTPAKLIVGDHLRAGMIEPRADAVHQAIIFFPNGQNYRAERRTDGLVAGVDEAGWTVIGSPAVVHGFTQHFAGDPFSLDVKHEIRFSLHHHVDADGLTEREDVFTEEPAVSDEHHAFKRYAEAVRRPGEIAEHVEHHAGFLLRGPSGSTFAAAASTETKIEGKPQLLIADDDEEIQCLRSRSDPFEKVIPHQADEGHFLAAFFKAAIVAADGDPVAALLGAVGVRVGCDDAEQPRIGEKSEQREPILHASATQRTIKSILR